VAVFVSLGLTFVIAFVALSVDMGMLYATKAEMQRAADAAAMAGAWRLLDEERLKGSPYEDVVNTDSRTEAANLAAANVVLTNAPIVSPTDDVDLGVWNSHYGTIDFAAPDTFNAVSVWVRRDESHGGSIAMAFGKALGINAKDLSAYAVAGFEDSIGGFEVTSNSGNAQLLPFTLLDTSWEGLIDATVTNGDNYSYDAETGAVTAGADGIPELNLYPGAGAEQLSPGNFGTVDLGSAGNSSADIARQILEGVNAGDLSYFGGSIQVPIDLNGDTGLSAGFKDELEAIKGQARSIPIFESISGNGNNAMYKIVAWGGIRIMNVKLNGSMTSKRLIIQPAYVVDQTAVAGSGGTSDYVYAPVQLIE
jgi:hypothetical protein